LERWQNEGSFGCEAVARVLELPNVPECAMGFRFLSCLYAAKIPLSFCHLFCLFTMNANVSRLCVVADFQHKSSIGELHLNLPENCHTKHCTRHYAKPLLCAALLFLLSVNQSFNVRFCRAMAWWLFCKTWL